MFLHPDMLVDDVMRRWPTTIRTFLEWRMKCVGCPFGVFHTIEDASVEHQTDLRAFLRALEETIELQSPLVTPARLRPGERAGADRG